MLLRLIVTALFRCCARAMLSEAMNIRFRQHMAKGYSSNTSLIPAPAFCS